MDPIMIHVIIPTFNCREWIERCLRSVAEQGYAYLKVQIIDDASTDGQQAIIKDFVNECGPNWSLECNGTNMKCPANLVTAIQLSRPGPEDVIFLLDGDDFLPHDAVISRIAEVYQDPGVWLTYGNYDVWPHNTGQVPAEAYSEEQIIARDFRIPRFNHPLTFRHFLWEQIPQYWFKYDDGRWLDVGYDRAIMFPMLEMAADHFRFLDETLYTYNGINPLSDVHVRLRAAQDAHRLLGARPKMPKLARSNG